MPANTIANRPASPISSPIARMIAGALALNLPEKHEREVHVLGRIHFSDPAAPRPTTSAIRFCSAAMASRASSLNSIAVNKVGASQRSMRRSMLSAPCVAWNFTISRPPTN
jgi:hypothetical protein